MKMLHNICIIDDDPIAIFGIKRLLKPVVECNNINTYENGKLALDGIQKDFIRNKVVPEIIFLDINMPIMDGWQFLKSFIGLQISQKVQVNIVTSSIDAFDFEQFKNFKEHMTHKLNYYNKPLTTGAMKEIIR